MNNTVELIKTVNIQDIDDSVYKKRYVGCLVVTHDDKILLQQRGLDWNNYPGFLSEFGGHIEAGETSAQALVRELHEELGAHVNMSDVISLGAFTESITGYTELVYAYYWQDKHQTIMGCYEGEAKYYDNRDEVFKHPKIMDSVRWLLNECHQRKLL